MLYGFIQPRHSEVARPTGGDSVLGTSLNVQQFCNPGMTKYLAQRHASCFKILRHTRLQDLKTLGIKRVSKLQAGTDW